MSEFLKIGLTVFPTIDKEGVGLVSDSFELDLNTLLFVTMSTSLTNSWERTLFDDLRGRRSEGQTGSITGARELSW